MRLLHVIWGMQKAAGTSVFCGELCTELRRIGYDITIAVCNLNAEDVYSVDEHVEWISVSDVIKSGEKFDLVHIHALWSPILHCVSRWAYHEGIPIVWSPHGMLQKWALKNKWWKKIAALALYQWRDLHSAALLHATAQSEVDDIRRLGFRNKVVVAPLGIRIPLERIRTFEHSNIRTLLFVSRVQRKKGLPNLVEAWSRLPQDLRKGWQIRIVGPEQDNHITELKAQCDRLGITYKDERFHCPTTASDYDFTFTGPKYDAELDAEYSNADLFVLPTHSENFGSVVIEALAHGVPVITTKQAPWAELGEFKCGWWIDDNIEALTAALREALPTSTFDLDLLGRNGRVLVEDRYTWSAVCDKMVRGYEEVLNGRS